MAAQRKASFTNIIQVLDRNNRTKGRLEINTGGIDYYRTNAITPTISRTLQQLVHVLEKEAEYEAIDMDARLPKGLGGGKDFSFTLDGLTRKGKEFTLQINNSLAKQSHAQVDKGAFHLDPDFADGSSTRGVSWYGQVSVALCLRIVAWYIKTVLIPHKKTMQANAHVVIPRAQMRKALLQLLKMLD